MNIAFWRHILLGLLFTVIGGVGFCFGIEEDRRKRYCGLATFIIGWSMAFTIFTLAVFMCQSCGQLPVRNLFTNNQYCYYCGEDLHLPTTLFSE